MLMYYGFNDRIQKFSATGVFITKWEVMHWRRPVHGTKGVAVDSSGNVYVADTGNHRIQKLNASVYL